MPGVESRAEGCGGGTNTLAGYWTAPQATLENLERSGGFGVSQATPGLFLSPSYLRGIRSSRR